MTAATALNHLVKTKINQPLVDFYHSRHKLEALQEEHNDTRNLSFRLDQQRRQVFKETEFVDKRYEETSKTQTVSF